MTSRAEWGLGAGSIPLACPGAQRLTEGLPGLEGWQVGTKVWLVLDGATGEGHLTWDISTGVVAHLGVACSTTRCACFINKYKNTKIIYLNSSKGLPVACGETQLTRNPWFMRNITLMLRISFKFFMQHKTGLV